MGSDNSKPDVQTQPTPRRLSRPVLQHPTTAQSASPLSTVAQPVSKQPPKSGESQPQQLIDQAAPLTSSATAQSVSQSDVSKPGEQYNENEIKEALASQKRMYEEKYQELRQPQKNIIINEKSNNGVCQQTNQNNLHNNNAQMTAAHTNPTTNFQNPSNAAMYRNPTPNNYMQQPGMRPAGPLSPNQYNIFNNNAQPMTAVHTNPSTSSTAICRNSTPNNYFQQQGMRPTGPLSPNQYSLPNYNAQPMTAAHTNPSTSNSAIYRNQSPQNHVFQQTGMHPASQLSPNQYNLPNNNAQPMTASHTNPSTLNATLFPLQPQHPIQTAQAAPSSSSTIDISAIKPDLSQSEPQIRDDAAEAIKKCATCSNELGLEIYQCKKGHSSCKECKMKKSRCGLCPEMITDMRNYALEAEINNLKQKEHNDVERMKCPNSENGCPLFMKKHKLKNHMKQCPYREMACPLTAIFENCSWKGKQNRLVMHFKEAHQDNYEADINKEMCLPDIKINQRIVRLVNIGALQFLIHIDVDKDQKCICMTVQSLGSKLSASKWSYEVHIYNKQQPWRKYQCFDLCISNSDSVKEIFTQKLCAVLSWEHAKTFLDNDQLTYKFFIKKNAVLQ